MNIQKNRIRSLKPYIAFLRKGSNVIVGISGIERHKVVLKRIGFSDELRVGERLLPPATFGSASQFNAEGKYIKRTDLPLETAYRQVEWHWEEWHGNDRVERSKIVDVPYKRYPREFVPPPSVEFTITSKMKGKKILVSPPIKYVKAKEGEIIHTINLFLDVFGECELFTEGLGKIFKPRIKRLNWRILPPGEMPWKQLRKEVDPLIREAKEGYQPVIKYRLEIISGFGPDFTAIGLAGFHGYISIWIYEERHLCL